MLNYQCIIEKHSEQMQGYGLGRESADNLPPPPCLQAHSNAIIGP